MNTWDLDRLEIIARRAASLPVMPAVALELVTAIDAGDGNINALERIVAKDPAFASEIMRACCTKNSGETDGKIRSLIIRMGLKSLRAMAVSIAFNQSLKALQPSASFNPAMFAAHSMAVGVLARYLLVRTPSKLKHNPEIWSPEELFSAGLLHDLGLATLARVDRDLFAQVSCLSKTLQITHAKAFATIFGTPATSLGARMCEEWGFPPLFTHSQQYMHQPFAKGDQVLPLCCLHLADYLANKSGLTLDGNPVQSELQPGVVEVLQIPQEEFEPLTQSVRGHVAALLENPSLLGTVDVSKSRDIPSAA